MQKGGMDDAFGWEKNFLKITALEKVYGLELYFFLPSKVLFAEGLRKNPRPADCSSLECESEQLQESIWTAGWSSADIICGP